jgi:MFS family permease
MTFSPTATLMITAQALCGAAASVIVPSLVALIAENYHGVSRQPRSVRWVLQVQPPAYWCSWVGGVLGTFLGWRPAFGILMAVSAIVFLLSFRLKSFPGRAEVKIDMIGVLLAATAIILISFGFNNLNRWGAGLAGPNAPFDLLGVSPAPIFIVIGIVLGQAFLMWTHRRQAAGKTPLLALEVIDSPQERAAVYAMFAVVALEAMLNFTVPLYIQIVQGRTPYRHRDRHDAVQPHGFLRRHADRAIL